MGSYYYLGAQLPYLIYGRNPPMSSAAFKVLATEQMSSSDAALLEYCCLDPDPLSDPQTENQKPAPPEKKLSYANPVRKTSSPLINRWKEWERLLRLNLAKARAQKLKREIKESERVEIPETPSEILTAVRNSMTIESPLEAELFLDKTRFNAIDGFLGIDIFSENAMCAYLLKLLLMERRAAFVTEDGYEEYERLYAAILGQQETSGEAK